MKWFLKIFINPYSYDIHGNVDTLLQDNQQLSLISTALQPQRFKKIAYDFDLISGNVNLVSYQDGQPDAFYHFYEYDADNRIIAVYSSNYPQKNALININTVSNSPLWDNDAKYFYYAHGPLARVEYGDNKVQGQDYAYTLQGWIKGVNSNTLDTARDMGKDGAIGSVNSIFAKDAFGYTLNYHTNDYNAIDGLKWNNANNRFESIVPGSDLNNSRNDLFNGNITSMVTTIVPPTLPKSDSVAFSPLPQGTAYKYDQLNRLVEMKAWQNLNPATNTWGTGLAYNGMYHNKFSYNANGAMLTAFANNLAGDTIDNQIYHHQIVNGRTFSNRTYAITDSATKTSGDDLLNQIKYTNNADSINVYNNYSYDEIGERKSDVQDSIALITWTVNGKLDSIARIPGSSKYNLKFDYDANNKRIAKKVYTSNSTWLYSEYYVRDAQGNLMSTYTHQIIDNTATVSFAQTEKEIYGSNELGIDVTKTEMISTLPISNVFSRTLDNKHYTGSNHLGNVLTTFTDRKLPVDMNNDGVIDEYWPNVIASNDYMPFGAFMTERTFKRETFPNGFNGKRDDPEFKGQDYGMREYFPEQREFPTPDPLAHKFPYYSPYQFAGNNPIKYLDLDGAEKDENKGDASKNTGDQIIYVRVDAVSAIKSTEDIQNHGGIIGGLFKRGTGEKLKSTTELKVLVKRDGTVEVLSYSFKQTIKNSVVKIGDFVVYQEPGREGRNASTVNNTFPEPVVNKKGVFFARQAQAEPSLSAQETFEAAGVNNITITQNITITISNKGKVNITTNASTFPTTTFNAEVKTTNEKGEVNTEIGQTTFEQQPLKEALKKDTFKTRREAKKVTLTKKD